eukprot:CAMPEP_0114575792 /NCGR_PEP_ID=MMETSP0125-20121206/620_1 /TAXON_ID=485358 ORGANISM="Aristerostoma sp., Strain ATCC 50986" /NCGR_SAMPLE_ID=MMETSP0125 /ASSEMBLY_ACC=CAM_ASM_000245 /LENGTH=127 /DNA_ID=CAMNT_0001763793 /DNA_START=755 /DNA_END=1138 /DNA_ORIENTATION=+
MTKCPCEVLTISLRDYNFLQTRYEKANTEMLNFLLDHVPDLDQAIREGFTRKVENLFNVMTVDIHNHVIVEGSKGSNFYLLYDGVCELYKNEKKPKENNKNYGNQSESSNKDNKLFKKKRGTKKNGE